MPPVAQTRRGIGVQPREGPTFTLEVVIVKCRRSIEPGIREKQHDASRFNVAFEQRGSQFGVQFELRRRMSVLRLDLFSVDLRQLRGAQVFEMHTTPNVAVHPAEGRRAAPLPRIGCNGLLAGQPCYISEPSDHPQILQRAPT